MENYCKLPALFLNTNASWRFAVKLDELSQIYQPYHGYISMVLCVFGIVNNFMNIIVLLQPNMQTSTNRILAAIALCHMGTMSSYLIYITAFHVLRESFQCIHQLFSKPWMGFVLFHSLWSILLHTSGLWLAVLLAFVRLNVVSQLQPNHWLMQPNKVQWIVLVVFLVVVVFCIPICFVTEITEMGQDVYCSKHPNSTDFETLYTTKPSAFSTENNCLFLRITLWMNGILFKLIPCILLACLISALLHNLKKARKRNVRLQNQGSALCLVTNQQQHSWKFRCFCCKRSERSHPPETVQISRHHSGPTATSRTTKMLATILLIFLVTELPQAILATLSGVSPSDVYFVIYDILGDVVDLLSLINSSATFVLYCTMNTAFRQTFLSLFVPSTLRNVLKFPVRTEDTESTPKIQSKFKTQSTCLNYSLPSQQTTSRLDESILIKNGNRENKRDVSDVFV